MMLNEGERLVVIASLQWAAMEHDKAATEFQKQGAPVEAAKRAAFSREAARIADMFKQGK
jgi:hypothetical protein